MLAISLLPGSAFSSEYSPAITGPLGRDIGQAIKSHLPLYDLTDPFSYDHMARYWHQIVPQK